jgi:hypothetical protein
MMQRVVHLAMMAFWTSVPLSAVALAISWPHLGWPGVFLWCVVVASSAFLTVWSFPPVVGEDAHSEARWTWESVLYPVILFYAINELPRIL